MAFSPGDKGKQERIAIEKAFEQIWLSEVATISAEERIEFLRKFKESIDEEGTFSVGGRTFRFFIREVLYGTKEMPGAYNALAQARYRMSYYELIYKAKVRPKVDEEIRGDVKKHLKKYADDLIRYYKGKLEKKPEAPPVEAKPEGPPEKKPEELKEERGEEEKEEKPTGQKIPKWCRCGPYRWPVDDYELIDEWDDPTTGRKVYHLSCSHCGGDVFLWASDYKKWSRRTEALKKGKEWEEEWKKAVEKEKPEEEWGRLSRFWGTFKPTGAGFRNIVSPLIMLVIGLMLSAILGGALFFFACLLGAIYYVLPQPVSVVEKRLGDIEKMMKVAKTKMEMESLKDMAEIEKIKAEFRPQIKMQTWLAGVKTLLKLGALALFALAFMTSNIPLAKPLGLIIALVVYFMMR